MPESQDGVYARRPWELTSQTLELQRREDADAQPQWYAPVMPVPDPYEMVPPIYGYRTAELGIDDILNDVYSRLQGSQKSIGDITSEWSGGNGGYDASSRPTGAGGGGVT